MTITHHRRRPDRRLRYRRALRGTRRRSACSRTPGARRRRRRARRGRRHREPRALAVRRGPPRPRRRRVTSAPRLRARARSSRRSTPRCAAPSPPRSTRCSRRRAGRTARSCARAFPPSGRTVRRRRAARRRRPRPRHRRSGATPRIRGDTSDVADILRRGAARPRAPRCRSTTCAPARSAALRRRSGAPRAASSPPTRRPTPTSTRSPTPRIASPGRDPRGLGRARAARRRALGHAGPAAPLPAGRAWLIVAGSLHPATRAQIRALEAAGVAGSRPSTGSSEPDTRALAAELGGGRPVFLTTADADAPTAAARAAWRPRARRHRRAPARARRARRCSRSPAATPRTRSCGALGADRLELTGAPASGLGARRARHARGRDGSRRRCSAKAGGFGAPDLFAAPPGRNRRDDRSHSPCSASPWATPPASAPRSSPRRSRARTVTAACRPVVIGDARDHGGDARAPAAPRCALHAVERVGGLRVRAGHARVPRPRQRGRAPRLPRGAVSAEAGRAAYAYIETAVRLCQARRDRRHRHRARQQGGARRRRRPALRAHRDPRQAVRHDATSPCC